MQVDAARAVLGVAPDAPWPEVRAAYKATIRRSHPDVGGSTAAAVAANVAYATLVRARQRPPAPRPAAPSTTPRAAVPAEVLDGDTIRVALPPDEAFLALLEAADQIGDVTYVDRSCAIFEALLPIEGEGVCSLVVTVQGRAHGTDAFCTLEAIEHVASPPVHHVARALVDVLRA